MVRESSHSAVTFPSESNVYITIIYTHTRIRNEMKGLGKNKMPPK